VKIFVATVTASFYAIVNAVKTGVQYVTEMNTALVNLSKVVDMTKSEMDEMQNSAISLGKELGKGSAEIMSGMAEWGRVTKDLNEIVELTRVATMASNVTDLSVADASKALSTSMINFKIQTKDAMSVLDQLNEIQNNYKASAKDVAEGLAEVGGAAQQSGVKIQEMEGFLTSLISSQGIQGSEAGTAMRSFISRTFRIGSEGAEDAGKAEEALKRIGVAVRDSQGQFRSFTDILMDTSKAWGTLDKVNQMAVAQAVGSTHHYSKFISLMEQMPMAVDATSSAFDSQNSAIKENAKFLDSIQGRTQVLGVTIEEKFKNLISSDGIKGFITILTKLTNTFMNLPAIIWLATTAFLAFKGKAIMASISQMIAYQMALGATSTASAVLAGVTSSLSLAFKSLTASMAANPIGWVAIGITALITVFSLFGEETEDLTQKLQELNGEMDKINTTNHLIKQYEELTKQIKDNNKKGLDNTDVKKKLIDVERQLAQQIPDSTTGYDDENTAIATNIKLVKKLNEEKQKEALIEAKNIYNQLKNKLSQKQQKQYLGTENGEVTVKSVEDDSLLEQYLKLKKARDDATDTESAAAFNEQVKAINNQIEEYNNNAIKLYTLGVKNVEIIDIGTGKFIKYTDAIDDNTNALDDNNSSNQNGIETDEEKQKKVEELTKSFQTSTTAISDYKTMQEELSKTGSLSAESIQLIISKYSSLMPYITDNTTLHNALNDALNTEMTTQNDLATAIATNAVNAQTVQIGLTSMTIGEIQKRIQAYGAEITAMMGATGGGRSYYLDSQTKAMMTAYADALRQINDIKTKLVSGVNTPKSSGSSTKSSGKSLANDLVEGFENRIDELKDRISLLGNIDTTEEKQKQVEFLNSITDVLKEESTAVQGEINNINNKLKTAVGDNKKELEDTLQELTSKDRKIQIDIVTNKEDIQSILTDLAKVAFETQQKIDETNLERSVYGSGGKTAWETASENKIKDYQDEIDALDKVEQTEAMITERTTRLTTLQTELNALTGTDEETQKRRKELSEQILAVELERYATADEIAEKQQKQLDIAKQQELLANISKEKNVRLYQNGEWTWVADPQKIKQETDTLNNMQAEYQKWELNNLKQHKRAMYEEQIKAEQALAEAKRKEYEKQKADLDAFYKDMDQLVSTWLTTLNDTYGTNLDKIISTISGKVAAVKALLTQLTDANAKVATTSSGGSIITTGSDGKTTVSVNTKTDADILKAQYGDKINVVQTGGFAGADRANTNEYYQELLRSKNIKPSKNVDLWQYETGGLNTKPGLAVLDGTANKPEYMLNGDITKLLLDTKNMYKSFISGFKPFDFSGVRPAMAGGSTPTYNLSFPNMTVQTNDARGFLKNMIQYAHVKT
jgi:TP901 family phage tail tape measure protein